MQADVAILFLGTNQLLEREGINRQYITLPPVQLRLLQRVLEANPKTVVVLLNGGPVSLARPSYGGKRKGSREMDIPAVLDMFWAGEEGGTAIADVLFGDYNPSGRLPYTVYSSDRDLPPMTQYDISKGFTYMYLNERPEYAFGHGLSYTTFGYNSMKISPAQITSNGHVHVRVDVQNIGTRAGAEVVQLYVRRADSGAKWPHEQLEGFERIKLNAGERMTVSFLLSAEQLSSWDPDKHAFGISRGAFDVMIGGSSDDIRQKASFQVTTDGDWPPSVLTTRAADSN
jgi:beta-glucosidase